MVEESNSETPNTEPSPTNETDSEARWMSLRDAETLTGVRVRTLRTWYGSGKIESRLVPGPHGPQREVRADQIEQVRGERYTAAGQTSTAGEAVLTGRMGGAGLVPVEVFEKIEAAWQEVVMQTARAEVAEAKLEFEQERRKTAEQRVAELEGIAIPTQTMADMGQELKAMRRQKGEEPAEKLPDIDDAVVEQMAAELNQLRRHRQAGPSEPWWPDLPDEAIEEVGQDVGELRAHQPPQPWWHRIWFRRPR